MNQIALPLRARNTDPITSHEAAKHAKSDKAERERHLIRQALEDDAMTYRQGLTAKELSWITDIDYIEVQRRISEIKGIQRTGGKRMGCMVWSVCQ